MGAFSGLMSLITLTVFASTNIGDKTPGFMDGTQWIKGKPLDSLTILELSRSSCPNCRAQMPHLSALQKAYGDRVSIVTVTSDPRTSSGVLYFNLNIYSTFQKGGK
jgi:thiol-disulfide isomerase/thioredoxin